MISDFIAKFTLEEKEPIKAKFSINLTPTKVSQLENDLDFVRRDEVNLPDIVFDELATKKELKTEIDKVNETLGDINSLLDAINGEVINGNN